MSDDERPSRDPIPLHLPRPLSPLPPTNDDAGWVDMVQLASISHIPLADATDVLASAGLEIRLQVRPKRDRRS